MRPARPLLQRARFVTSIAVARHPVVANLATDSELATELSEVELPFALVPSLLPLQHELHSLLHRIRFLPGHAPLSGMSSDYATRVSGMSSVRSVRDLSGLYRLKKTARRPLKMAFEKYMLNQ